jgi:hypothetical protein
LADFFETLRLNESSSWARTEPAHQDRPFLIDTVAQLASFDRAVLAGQAEIVIKRIDGEGSRGPFFALFDGASTRELTHWEQVPDKEQAVRMFVRMHTRGRGSALVAASALWEAPVADIAVPLLDELLPHLTRSPEHQRICAYTLVSLTRGFEVPTWADDENSVLRRVAAELMDTTEDRRLTPKFRMLVFDRDGWVRVAALKRLERTDADDCISLLRQAACERDPGWRCTHCGTDNGPQSRSCTKCSTVGPSPAATARSILDGLCPS